ncbi:D-alanyl-D-alanine endopeptidase [Lacisediminimonas profundi]|uniref:D-alanyl-D-alanine endopeptidase n=1 Tax=Lacisediminimonas profundi TaxID=2603856 RepID=UPI00124B0F78|nr:D-alanyl-D-alanine endopeptidase [Lacisediminimonas profundi]
MLKAALGVLFSFVALVVFPPVAHAADTSTAARSAKHKAQPKKASGTRAVKRSKAKRRAAATTKATAKPVRSSAVRRKGNFQRVGYSPAINNAPAQLTAGDIAGLHLTRDPLELKSNVALVIDQNTSDVLLDKNASVALPIASITKLMTALVVVEANQRMDELLTVTDADVDREKFSHSRLRVGSQLTRADMLHIALMSSENRAASALGRHYPGGIGTFVAAMNAKARQLGMSSTRYVDSTGLSSGNVSSARDLAKLVVASYQHPVIREYSTDQKYVVEPGAGVLHYKNSNYLVDNSDWNIGLQKTGYIAEAGRCLVMQAKIEGRAVVMIFLDSKGKLSRIADASRVRRWIESNRPFLSSRIVAQQG